MKIISMSIRNFKGISSLDIQMNGRNMNIFGANEAGKTTIFDAFTWLLFDKDSLNQSDFEIKPIDPVTRETIHFLNTEVSAVLLLGSDELEFKKVYYEKWEKKRGTASETFTGHTTDCFVNGVPVKKSEFSAKIAEIADESVFKLLSNPLYFNEVLHWKERRELLLKVCGDITMDDVFASDRNLESLREVLTKYSLENYRKIINSKRKEINDQLGRIPVRIDEVQKSIPDVSGINFDEIEQKIKEARDTQEEHRAKISGIRNGSEISQKQKAIAEIDTALINLRNAQEQKKAEALKGLRAKVSEATNEYDSIKRKLSNAQNELSFQSKVLEGLQKDIDVLYNRWYEVNDEVFTPPEQDNVCPTCGQQIPEWKLAEAVEKAEKAFNLDKSRRLEEINEKGKALAEERDAKKAKIDALETEIQKIQTELEDAKANIDQATKEYNDAETSFADVTKTQEYQDKLAEKQKLNNEIAALRAGSQKEISVLENLVNVLENSIRNLQAEYAKKAQVEEARKRIRDLMEEESRLGKEYEALEKELYKLENYERAEANLLEVKINSKFRIAKFKLFNQQINGGIEPCCETLHKGVPYASMNHAARTQVGLDIIQTLSEFYNFTAPIFIDNREGITDIPYIDAQVISLYVSPEDKVLRMEAV